MEDICLVIPSTNRHATHIGNLLTSIEKQTLPPKEIIIAMSEADDETCESWKKQITDMTTLNIQIDCVARKAYAAENRNRGGELCTSNIISFMDTDDTMSHDRLETVVSKMTEYTADAFLHNFNMNKKCSGGSGKTYTAGKLRDVHNHQKNNNGPIHLNMNPMPHHGHFTVRKHVFEDLKQDESEQYRRSEDSEYVRRVIDHGHDTIFTDLCLSDYNIQNSTSNY
tara:strand:+ start:1242 stop:1916 length:675 start_codon:yes stop_codon:yes gene_type:complete